MQLLKRTWPLLASNLLMLGTSVLCMAVLSTMRAYVGGESLWSKAQKDAVTHLRQFAYGGDLNEFKRFREALAIPLGDRVARLELLKPDPDLAIVYAGFRAGGIHPDDMPWMARLFRGADHVPYMKRALQIWAQGDGLIDQLDDVADQLLAETTSNRLDTSGRAALMAQIDRIDFELRPLEDAFSEALGQASRITTRVLEWIAALSSGLFLAIGVALSRSIMRRASSIEQALRSSERRVLAEQQRAQVTLASIYDSVLTADGEGRIDFQNAVACQITGWSVPEARGRPLAEVLRLAHEGRHDPVAWALSELRAGSDPTERLHGAVLIDYVKIDGSFVHKMHTDAVDRVMVASIHRIGRVMGLRTVAERVECDSVLQALRDVGVDYAQGYAIARPMPLAALIRPDGERAGVDPGQSTDSAPVASEVTVR